MDQEQQQSLHRASWLEIDLQALAGNIQALRHLLKPTTQLMAVVKGNAYGHGAGIVAAQAARSGVDRLAVATVDEGIELRQTGIRLPILVLGHTPLTAVAAALHHHLTLTVHAAEPFAALADIARGCAQPATVHLKVNTGMNRLGFDPTAVGTALAALQRAAPAIVVEGIFTHFATADAEDQSFLQVQFARFEGLLTELARNGLRPPIAHAANSAATVAFPAAHLDLVRCGIALYGLHPAAESCRLSAVFQPVLRWKAQVVQLTALEPSATVSYGRTFQATQPMVVATIPVGYADGFPRGPTHWGAVLIQGEEAPIVGRVCMDQSVVDVTHLIEGGWPVQIGDEVVLIGQQGQRSLTAEVIGQRIGTINYEVVSRILARVPRRVTNQCKI